jgi:hypothetical protein
MNEVAKGIVKRGRPPKVAGITTVEDSTLDAPLYDEAQDDIDNDMFQANEENYLEPDIRDNSTTSDYVTPKVSRQRAAHFQRLEEIENELIKAKGRYIEHVDDAKAGVPYKQLGPNGIGDPYLEGFQTAAEPAFVVPLINTLNVRADGYAAAGGLVFDTGANAQPPLKKSANPHDPSSESFMVCINKLCSYREGCLRYRMSNRRDNRFPFHPAECRKDGIYISINDTKFSGYDPFATVESGGIPSANSW